MAGRPYKVSPDRWLVISDLQIPFEAEFALEFCWRLAKEYRVPPENVLCVGDEVDQYFGSTFKRDPDALHTPDSEIQISREKVADWAKQFPQMKLAVSNHGMRWAKRAFDAELPSQMLRPYQDLIGSPPGWKWKYRWVIKAKHPFQMIHGMGYSGFSGARNAAIDAGMSTVIGHLHSHAGISHVRTSALDIWGMNVGALIDEDAYAFNYHKHCRHKSCLGAGVVIDGGKTPIWHPYDP